MLEITGKLKGIRVDLIDAREMLAARLPGNPDALKRLDYLDLWLAEFIRDVPGFKGVQA